MKFRFVYIIIILLFVFSCSKNKLTEGQEKLIGKYSWVSTGTSDGSIWTNNDPAITKAKAGYSAELELDDKGWIIFYKDGKVINKSTYTILEKDAYDEHSAYIYIKLKNTDGLTLNEGKMSIHLSLDTNVTVDKFPFPAIDDVSNYYSGNNSLNNSFVKQ